MDLVTMILVLLTVGGVSLFVNKCVPMDTGVQSLLNFTVVVFLVVWFLCNVFGVSFA